MTKHTALFGVMALFALTLGTTSCKKGNKTEIIPATKLEKAIKHAQKFTLDKSEATLSIGEELTLVPTIEPKDAAETKITWKSSEEKVASVSPEGVIKALALGTTTITATLTEKLSAKVVITVAKPHPATLFAKTNFDGTAFLKDNANVSQVAMPFPKTLDQVYTVDGQNYRLPTRNEWSILVPVSQYADDDIKSWTTGQLVYGKQSYSNKEVEQIVVLDGKKVKFLEEHKGGATLSEQAFGKEQKTHYLSYAIRFEKAKKEGEGYAKDNKLRAAYRYDFGVNYDGVALDTQGKPKEENGYKQFALHITVRPLGEDWNGTIDDIAKEDFWKSNDSKDIKITLTAVGQGGSKGFNQSGSYFAPQENENISKTYTGTVLFNTRGIFTESARRNYTYPLRLIRVVK